MNSLEILPLLPQFRLFLACERRLTQNTCAAYCSDLQIFAAYLTQRKKNLAQLQVRDYERFIAQQIKQRASNRTAVRRLAAIRTFAAFLRQHCQLNLKLTGVASPKLQQPLPKFLSLAQVEALLQTAKGQGQPHELILYTVINSLYCLGLRVSELTSLKLSQINFSSNTIKILGKGQKERIVPLPERLVPVLKDFIQQLRPLLLKGKNCELVFFTQLKGNPVPFTRAQVSSLVVKCAKEAKIGFKVTPHVLRHSIATHLLNNGANLKLLQTFLGHADIATVQVYTHIETKRLRLIYDANHPLK